MVFNNISRGMSRLLAPEKQGVQAFDQFPWRRFHMNPARRALQATQKDIHRAADVPVIIISLAYPYSKLAVQGQ
jgi:hypothetical protein